MCMPLFTRTARFDITPNRFGVLGQFGPDRKLQLITTNLTAMVGYDGRLLPNASIEFDVYVSNVSHPLSVFEYTKHNNKGGVSFAVPPPAGGWRAHRWHSFAVPLTELQYSYPQSTPWHVMDRLELYYAAQSRSQPLGDFIRIRNIYVRSTRSFRLSAEPQERSAKAHCRDYPLVQKLRKLRPGSPGRSGLDTRTALEAAIAAATARRATSPLPRGGGGGPAAALALEDPSARAYSTPSTLPSEREGQHEAPADAEALPDANGGIPSFGTRRKSSAHGRRASIGTLVDSSLERALALFALGLLVVSSVGVVSRWLPRNRLRLAQAIGLAESPSDLPFAGSRIE